jgi:hypothetical protein
MANVDDDIQAQAAMSGDRFIEPTVEAHNKRLKVLAFAAGAQPNTG